MLRLCDCDMLLNSEVLSSLDLLIDRECERLKDSIRLPLLVIETERDMLTDVDIDSDFSRDLLRDVLRLWLIDLLSDAITSSLSMPQMITS